MNDVTVLFTDTLIRYDVVTIITLFFIFIKALPPNLLVPAVTIW